MSLTSRIRSIITPERVFLNKSIENNETAVPISQKVAPALNRVPREILLATYLESPVIFNSTNKVTQILARTKYELQGDEHSVSFFQELLDSIGTKGGDKTWKSMKYDIFMSQVAFGWQPTELIYNEKGDKIVDLDTIDPITFDYAKNVQSRIALDEYGNPVGYIQSLNNYIGPVQQKITPPEAVRLLTNQIYIPPERVALFKLHTMGTGFYPIGLIEPIYNTYIRHKAAEEGFATAAYRLGNPVPYAKIGDALHQPSEDKLKKAAEKLKEMNANSSFSSAYYDNIEFLETKESRNLRTFLDYWVDMEVAGIGLPRAFATGEGGETNRATLARQEYFVKLALQDVLDKTAETIRFKIFKKIADLENANSKGQKIVPPIFVFKDIALEELDSKSVRLVKYATSGLITPSKDTENFIRKMEDLPEQTEWVKPVPNPQFGGNNGTRNGQQGSKPDKE